MKKTLIRNACIVNEGRIHEGDVLIENGRIEQIGGQITAETAQSFDAMGKFLMPGIIDDQVHFREPGLTHKADIQSESRAAVVGGVTSFMEMPNVKPPTLTQTLLEKKYETGAMNSLANYSFFMGVSNDNMEEAIKTDPERVCGLKIFMGSSTGNMLVDKREILDGVFEESPLLIAVHCEDEHTIRENTEKYIEKYGEDIPFAAHPLIRNEEACYLSSSFAIDLAKKHGTRLHILHISTEEELQLFRNDIPLTEKQITSEVCVHHLYFDSAQYPELGSRIKCNPAIKEPRHKEALLKGLLDDRLDIVATDHAPHTLGEKSVKYLKAPSGLPLVQDSLMIMLDFYHKGQISMEKIVEKMCHAPAQCFKVRERGYIREGYWADLVLVDPDYDWKITRERIRYKCGWSPLEGMHFKGRPTHTFVNGNLVYEDGILRESAKGMRLLFDRN